MDRRRRKKETAGLRDAHRGTKPDKENARGSTLKKSPSLATVAQFCETWGEAYKKHHQYTVVARQLSQIAGHLKPEELPPLLPTTLINSWKGSHAAWTVHKKAAILRQLLRSMAATTGCPDMAALMPRTRRGQQRTKIAHHAELQKLYLNAEPCMRFCLICWTQLAMRFSEALKPTPADYDAEKRTLQTKTKGDKPRTFPVTDELARMIEGLNPLTPADTEKPIFMLLYRPHENDNEPEKVKRRARERWYRLKDRAGIDTGKKHTDTETLKPHDLRRTAATRIHRATKDVLAAQQLLGHSDLATTTAYLKPFEPTEMQRLIEQTDMTWTH